MTFAGLLLGAIEVILRLDGQRDHDADDRPRRPAADLGQPVHALRDVVRHGVEQGPALRRSELAGHALAAKELGRRARLDDDDDDTKPAGMCDPFVAGAPDSTADRSVSDACHQCGYDEAAQHHDLLRLGCVDTRACSDAPGSTANSTPFAPRLPRRTSIPRFNSRVGGQVLTKPPSTSSRSQSCSQKDLRRADPMRRRMRLEPVARAAAGLVESRLTQDHGRRSGHVRTPRQRLDGRRARFRLESVRSSRQRTRSNSSASASGLVKIRRQRATGGETGAIGATAIRTHDVVHAMLLHHPRADAPPPRPPVDDARRHDRLEDDATAAPAAAVDPGRATAS